MILSQKWLHQKLSFFKSHSHIFSPLLKKRSWELDILSWSQLTIKQAKSRSSQFFSEAIYPPKFLSAVQQPSKYAKFRPGSYLSPPSNAVVLFYRKYLQALWKTEETGTQKAWQGLVSWEVYKAQEGFWWFVLALAQSSQRNPFWVWLMLALADTRCGSGLLWRFV